MEAASILNNATLTMSENASVTGCNSIAGGGVSARGNATESDPPVFIMEGSSSITDCTALNGGGIFVSTSGGKVSLSGSAKIKNCRTVKRDGVDFPNVTGGGVHVSSGSFEMSGGSIESCTAVNGGDSVFVYTGGNGKFTMTGGTVDGSITMPYTVGNNTVYMDGLGTAAYPDQISTADQLKLFRDKVNNATKEPDTKICAELTEDIDLNGEAWTPIGIGEVVYWGIRSYSGTFDGKGHTIKNLSIDRSAQNVGLFGYVYGGTIRNLTVLGSVKGTGYTGGIAGAADGGTFENCANLCEVQGGTTENDTTGGIIGFAPFGDNLIVRDCYNVGSITGRHAGGIIGQCINWLETIRNCYNAGTVTGTANVGAIIGNYSFDKISNCYYLEGSVIRNGNGDKASIAKTATEFAAGTVLALLKAGERDNNADPWADECKYLDAAGKTLPVFNGQGDEHTHNGNWTSNGNGTHSRRCTCNAVETQNCSGGTATCKDKAVCEICKESYGSLDPNSHTDLKHVDAKAATAAEEGNIEYWYCKACEKYFSDADAQNEITQAQTVIPKRQSSGSNYSYYTIKATAGAGGSISPSGNVSVREGRDQTFTITPDQGYTVSDVKIDGESVGAVTSYSFENVRKAHTIAVSFATIKIFVDVPAGSYYEDAVDWAVENGITKGTDDTHFSPDGICTRAQAVTFLWRAAGSPEPETRAMPFTDVPVGSYYYDAVLWAIENGITKGTSDTTFSPNMTCSRAQIVTFLWRSQKSPAVGSLNPFTDVSANAYYTDAVLWAVEENITKGTTATTFSPDTDCTRAQIVTLLYRAYVK